jgi:hypothetical protein
MRQIGCRRLVRRCARSGLRSRLEKVTWPRRPILLCPGPPSHWGTGDPRAAGCNSAAARRRASSRSRSPAFPSGPRSPGCNLGPRAGLRSIARTGKTWAPSQGFRMLACFTKCRERRQRDPRPPSSHVGGEPGPRAAGLFLGPEYELVPFEPKALAPDRGAPTQTGRLVFVA